MSIINLLASRNFIVVNKDVARKIGLDEAIMLGELASEYSYWENRDELTDDGYFFSTVENVEENTTFSQYKQQKAIEKLASEGLLYVSRRGIPAKRYLKLREDNILRLFENRNYTDIHDEPKAVEKKKQENYSIEFEEIWKKYPKKQGKEQAKKAYIKARKEGAGNNQVIEGLERYVEYIGAMGIEEKYIKNGSIWFNQHCWEDDYRTKTSGRNPINEMQRHDWNYDELERLAARQTFQ